MSDKSVRALRHTKSDKVNIFDRHNSENEMSVTGLGGEKVERET